MLMAKVGSRGVPTARVLFLDLDGTLLSSNLTISSRNLAALTRAAELGVLIVMASGRPTSSIARFSSMIPHRQFIIASNGGVTIETTSNLIIDAAGMSRQLSQQLLHLSNIYDVSVCLYEPLQWYARRLDPYVLLEVERSGTEPKLLIDDMHSLEPCIKALIIGSSEGLRSCEAELESHHSHSLHWFYTYPEYLEVMPLGISKGRACLKLLKHLNLSEKDAIAIGDGANDLPMLAVANTKIAVANASSALLSAADFIAPSNDEDGVAVAIEALILGDQESLSTMNSITQRHRG